MTHDNSTSTFPKYFSEISSELDGNISKILFYY